MKLLLFNMSSVRGGKTGEVIHAGKRNLQHHWLWHQNVYSSLFTCFAALLAIGLHVLACTCSAYWILLSEQFFLLCDPWRICRGPSPSSWWIVVVYESVVLLSYTQDSKTCAFGNQNSKDMYMLYNTIQVAVWSKILKLMFSCWSLCLHLGTTKSTENFLLPSIFWGRQYL